MYFAYVKVSDKLDMFYMLSSLSNPNNLQLSDDTVSVFRSYPWPFQYKMNDNILNMLSTAFRGKDC